MAASVSVKSRKVPEVAARKRRSGEEARTAILDAAETMLREVGPDGIRLQEVAAAVGVSHPTVLHHFGSREGLVEALVKRSLESIQSGVLEDVTAMPGTEGIAALLDRVAAQMKDKGRARTLLWLALSGHGPGLGSLHVRELAEAVHEVRRHKRAGKKRMPSFEDTSFSVLLPALALLSLSVLEEAGETSIDVPRFRAWLARLVHHHLENAQ
jgi:AcrR family transcriptional regulator